MKYIGVYLNAGRRVSPLAQTLGVLRGFEQTLRGATEGITRTSSPSPAAPSLFFSRLSWWLLFMAPVQMWGNVIVFLLNSSIFFFYPVAFRKALYII